MTEFSIRSKQATSPWKAAQSSISRHNTQKVHQNIINVELSVSTRKSIEKPGKLGNLYKERKNKGKSGNEHGSRIGKRKCQSNHEAGHEVQGSRYKNPALHYTENSTMSSKVSLHDFKKVEKM